MEIAMCDYLLPTVDPPENYHVDNPVRTVGQIVSIFCKNTTVAIVQCMPDLKWNATVPSCNGEETGENMGALLIIVWVVGGILLFSLLVLIIIIVSSRSKTPCCNRGPSSPTTSVFRISGNRTNRQGGDNPGFSRADERCGEWSFHRPRPNTDSERLPSYHEAILSNYITVPARAGHINNQAPSNFIRVNAPPSYRSSQQHSSREHGLSENHTATLHQVSSDNLDTENSQTVENQNTASSQVTENQNITTNQTNDNQNMATNQINVNQNITNQISENENATPNEVIENYNTERNHSIARLETISSATSEQILPINRFRCTRGQRRIRPDAAPIPRRYAERYPQCFFEEDPPPPYSSGLSSNHNRPPSWQTRSDIRECHPNWRRSLHAVRSSYSDYGQSELQPNQNFRRSMYSRPPHLDSFHSNYRPNPNAVSSHSDTGYQSRRNEDTSHCSEGSNFPSSNINHSSITSNNAPAHLNFFGNQSHTEALGSQSTSSLYGQNALNTFQSNSSMPSSNANAAAQSYVSTISIGGNKYENFQERTRSNESTNQKLYVIKGFHPTPSASLLLNPQSLNLPAHPHPSETKPLCTSTPINQSPATDRRFVPSTHPSPLPIAHKNHIPESCPTQEQLIFQRLRTELERNPVSFATQDQSSLPRYLPANNQPYPTHYIHPRHGIAPIARLESEYL